MATNKPWAVYSKYGQLIQRFGHQLQADHYAKILGDGATVRYVG